MRCWAAGLVAVGWLVAGCEPRIEEPIQRDHATDTDSPPQPGDAPKAKKRGCVRETEDKPKRVVLGPVPNPECPDDPGPVPVLGRASVDFVRGADDKKTVPVEVAEEDAHRQRGLMYRKSLPEDEGMLFIFEDTRELSFWMHNTCIPLDMVFVAADGTIVGIEENTPTLSDDTFSPGCPARYVIEVNAGWTRKNGIRAGMRVKLPR